MTTRIRLVSGLAVSLAALSAATASFGQTAAAPDQDTTRLKEIVVTAERRSENLQKVPVAVTSFTADSLATQQISAGLDLGRIVPDMFASNNVGQGSANVYYLRGLGQTQSFPTFEPQVGLYVDDIYVARVNANNFNLFGASQVQVLNGPQGTLFGRNSTGGAIVITLQPPGETFGGDAEFSYGSWNRFTGRGSIDIPLGDQIFTRTSAYAIDDDGWVEDVTTHQTLNATHNFGIREAIAVKPKGMSNIEWDLEGDYERNNSANMLNQPSASGGANGTDRISYTGFSTIGGALDGVVTGVKQHFGQGVVVESWGVTSNIKASFSAGTLNFITGFRGLQQDTAVDFALGTLPLVPLDQVPTGEITLAQAFRSSEYSQEIKWNGEVGDKLNYTVGAYYLYETNRNNYAQVLTLFAPPFALNDQFDKNDTSSDAVYAQADYKVTPALTLTVGGRYTYEIKKAWLMPNNGPASGYTTAQVNAVGISTHLDASEFTPRFVLSYQVNPDVLVFASATRGFQGGGWNGLTGAAPQGFNSFSPETIWSYEAGFRSETPDHRLRFNLTGFYEVVDNDQLLYDNPITDQFQTANAANMRGYGVEAHIEWEPVDNLNFTANLSGMKAWYYDPIAIVQSQIAACLAAPAPSSVNPNCDNGVVTEAGKLADPVYTPPFAASLMATYTFNFQSFTVTPMVAVQYTAREWFDVANSPGTSSSWPAPAGGQDAARALLDLGVTFAPRNLPFTITAECKNCTMVNYGTADLLALDYFNTPGQWDVRVNVKF